MRIVGFVGPSGTGKSHRALSVAKNKNIEYLIDDGLLIKGNRIVAGTSAKRESTRIGSIKRALFIYESHVKEVKDAILIHNPKALLILGTSKGMVERIAENLSLPKIQEIVYIHDIAKDLEINQALLTRKEQGKHVIPVPTFEIKKDFSGYFLDPLQIFRRKGKNRLRLVAEKSVVRPTFSYMGKYVISDYTIYQIAEHVILKEEGIKKILRFKVENNQEGIVIDTDLSILYGYPVNILLKNIQKKVRHEIEKLTGLNVKSLNLNAKSLVVTDKMS